MFLARATIILSVIVDFTFAKIYQRCELARELRNFDIPEDELATWVCIARYESNFDTGAMNHGSGDHGLFQISEIYWCSPPGYGCNQPCSNFRDDDISDDLQCIRRIHNEHKRLSGDGFNAWVVYPMYCKGDTASYIQDCFDEDYVPVNVTDNEISTEETDEDGYNFPALPSFNRNVNEDGYDFPKLPINENPFLRSLKIFDTNKPYSKTSINHSVSVGPQSTYPRESIDEFKPQNPFFNGKFSKLPYLRTSIHETALKRFEFPNFPHIKESIHDFKPAPGKFDLAKLPFSKQSINHFVPVARNNEITTIKPPSGEDATISNDVFPTSNNIYKFKAVPFTSKPVTTSTTTTASPKKHFYAGRSDLEVESTSTLKPFSFEPFHDPSTFFTFKPFTTKIKPVSTKSIHTTTTPPSTKFTFKPFFSKTPTIKPGGSVTTKLFPSSTFKFKPFSLKSISGQPSTTQTTLLQPKSSAAFSFKPFTTSTQSPQSRQLTFAPDSFFSWIFQSQTLPPLVPPVRPSRPIGPGPSLPLRPNALNSTRPLGLPRPPGLPPLRPLEGNSTRRPISRPPLPQADGDRMPRPGLNRPFRPRLTTTSVEPTVTTTDERTTEYKLDQNVTLVQSRYGFRFFRN